MRGRRGVLALVAVVTLSLWGVGVASSGGTRFDGPLPSCAVGDVLTPLRGPDDWARTLLDPTFMLEPDDAPADLVDVAEAGVPGHGQVRRIVIEDLRAMYRAADHAGVAFEIVSAYRSFDAQVRTFDSLARAHGTDYALAGAARAGHSEHQLGTTVDVHGGELWLATHGWAYGWVVSYPAEWSPGSTCYKAEPWHLRYVGREAAMAVHRAGVSLRAWLWEQQP